jgi:hypothetical protein
MPGLVIVFEIIYQEKREKKKDREIKERRTQN